MAVIDSLQAALRGRHLGPQPLLALGLIGLALCVSAFWLSAAIDTVLVPTGPGMANRLGEPAGVDFVAYYSAGAQAAAGDAAAAYDPAARRTAQRAESGVSEIGRFQFAYPPVVLPVLAALAQLPYPAALALWLVAIAAMAVAAAWWRLPHPLVPLVVVLFPGVTHNIVTGQNGALSAALMLMAVTALERRREALAGVAAAILCFKPHLALLLLVCLVSGWHRRALAAGLATGLSLLAATLLIYGPDPWLAWLGEVQASAGTLVEPAFRFQKSPSVFTALHQAGVSVGAAQAAQLLAALAAMAAAGWVWWRLGQGGRSLGQGDRHPAVGEGAGASWARACALVGGTGLISPYLYDYDLAIWLVVFIIAWGRALRGRVGWSTYALLLALWAAPVVPWFLALATGIQAGPLMSLALLGAGLAALQRGGGRVPRPISG